MVLSNHKVSPLMWRLLRPLAVVSLLCSAVDIDAELPEGEPTGAVRTWNFDTEATESLPKAFEVGILFDGRPAGEWKVLRTDRAQSSSQVLAQVQGKGAEHAYKTVLLNGTESADLDLEVSFLPIDGKADMGGGLIWRASDDRNYYLSRANPLEQNIRIYRVVK